MNRLIILWLMFFAFIHFTSKSQTKDSKDLKLINVSVDTIYSQYITLTYEFNESAENEYVMIYQCCNYCNKQTNYDCRIDSTIMSATNLQWIDSAGGAIPIYYSIGWKLSGGSAPQCCMILNTTSSSSGCKNSCVLEWNPYVYYLYFEWGSDNISGKLDSIDYYIFCKNVDKNGSFKLFDSIVGGDPSLNIGSINKKQYEARFLENNTNYEFFVKAVRKSDAIFSFSTISRFRTGYEETDPVDITTNGVSVIDNKLISIDVSTGYFSTPFNKLHLYRNEFSGNFPAFTQIKSLDYNSISNNYQFTDSTADPQKRLYQYMVLSDNKCKANDSSNIMTNIYLDGGRVQNEKYKDSIFFVQQGWSLLDTFELLRVVGNNKFVIKDFLSIENSRCLVDIEAYLGEGSVVNYQIKSKKNYFSNIISIDHEPTIEFPNAFYPFSKYRENQTFYPILIFASEENYLFIIYNRWGQEMFRATKPPHYCFLNPKWADLECLEQNKQEHRSWDGTFQGKDAPAGFYTYNISYSFNEKSGRFFTSGSFMLVR
ncbi:MAG: gliding motility-associated C-terminal domain-containing protein [Bacteroidales bacterium]|jgi:hypothetical protein|nr:gliding motility-associated C-terminal domain-containing protein [Bacteroidales bacterium]